MPSSKADAASRMSNRLVIFARFMRTPPSNPVSWRLRAAQSHPPRGVVLYGDDRLTAGDLGFAHLRGFVLGSLSGQERLNRRQADGGGGTKFSAAQRDRRAWRRVIEGYQTHRHFAGQCRKRYKQARIDVAG